MTVAVAPNRRTDPPTKGRLNEIREGAHGHACRLSRGRELTGRSGDLQDHTQEFARLLGLA